MHHSSLFERWRLPIVTAVAYFEHCAGGEFAFYPDGPPGPAHTLPVKHNTAIALDTDSIFHGVDRVTEGETPLPALERDMRLTFEEDETWRVGSGDGLPIPSSAVVTAPINPPSGGGVGNSSISSAANRV